MKNILIKLFLAFAAVGAVAGTLFYLSRRDSAKEKHTFAPAEEDDYFDPFGSEDDDCNESNCENCEASPICEGAAGSDATAGCETAGEQACDSCDQSSGACDTCESSTSAKESDSGEEVFFDADEES